MSANTARTQLLVNQAALPYADWAAEFRVNMPQEIRDHMDAVVAGTAGSDHAQSIIDRLRNYSPLFRLSRYRVSPSGDVRIGDRVAGGRETSPTTRNNDRPPTPRTPARQSPGGLTGDMIALTLAAQGTPAQPTRPSDPTIPRVVWISTQDASRSLEMLDDRAAQFLPDDNLIQVNADFRVFTDMSDYWCKRYELESGNTAVVEVVREWFEQALVETVIGCQSLQGERRWSPTDIDALLSEEALTAAVMQRYHSANAIKRSLGSKLGTLKTDS